MSSREELARVFLDQRPESAAHVLESLSPSESVAMLVDLPARVTGPVLAAMHSHYAARCMLLLALDYVVNVIQPLPSQRGATLLRALSPAKQDAVLNQLSTHQARTLRFLLSYSGNLVGAWIDPNVITVSPNTTVGDARLRLQQVETDDIHRLFLVDHQHKLKGSVSMSALFQSHDHVSVQTLAGTAPKPLSARTSLIVAEQHSDWLHCLEMPVIGRADEFIGGIRYSTISRALQTLRQGQSEVSAEQDQMIHGLTDLYSVGLFGAWQTWMELLSIPVDDGGKQNERKPGHHRGA